MKKHLNGRLTAVTEAALFKCTLTVLCYVLDILIVILYNGVSFFEENVINEE